MNFKFRILQKHSEIFLSVPENFEFQNWPDCAAPDTLERNRKQRIWDLPTGEVSLFESRIPRIGSPIGSNEQEVQEQVEIRCVEGLRD